MSSRQQKDTFSLEEDEILIEYVRENEALYDFSNKRYADSMYKNTLWTTIGNKLQKGKGIIIFILYHCFLKVCVISR